MGWINLSQAPRISGTKNQKDAMVSYCAGLTKIIFLYIWISTKELVFLAKCFCQKKWWYANFDLRYQIRWK